MKRTSGIFDKLLGKTADISLTGFVEDKELDSPENDGHGAYPVYTIKLKVNNEEELKKELSNQDLKDKMYTLAIDSLVTYEESMDGFNEYLENQFSGSIQDFEESLKIWFGEIIDNCKFEILQQSEIEIMFYIH